MHRLFHPGAVVAGAVLVLALAVGPVAAVNFPARIDLPNGWFPEGITSGPGTTFYVGSLVDGAIWRGDLRTGAGEVLVAGTPGYVAVGIDYETRAGRLWVAGGPTGTLTAYDAESGATLATYSFGAGFLNDVVVTDHAVYATDSFLPQLAVVPLGDDGELPAPSAATTLPLGGDLVYQPGFNANGIVEARGTLIVIQSNTGALFAVDPTSGVAAQVDLGGVSLTAGDGLELLGDILFVVRNDNRVAVVRLGPDLASGSVTGEHISASLDVPSTATFAAGRLWVVNARFTTPPGPTTAYWVTRLP